MKKGINRSIRKHSIRKIVLWVITSFVVIVAIVTFFVYRNFNSILSDALIKTFNSNLMSDVYELKFEKLSVNFLAGNIEVYNVKLQPREKPARNYPYINSSVVLKTEKMKLENVELKTLIKSKKLKLDKIEIVKPDVDLVLDGSNYILFPFEDDTAAITPHETKKNSIQSFFLKEFAMTEASFHVTNHAKLRQFMIRKLNISLKELMIDQHKKATNISNKRLELSVGEFTGDLQRKGVKHLDFKDYKTTIDSLSLQQRIDTAIYHFSDFRTRLNMLDIQTADSIFHVSIDTFDLSYKKKSIALSNVSFKPNISEAAMQKRFKFQTSQFSGTVGTMKMLGVNFDSLMYAGKIFIDDIALDKLSASIFKDQRKPVNRQRFPEYPGQQIKAIPFPLLIKQLKITNGNLVNRELKPDGNYARANINRATITATNFTTLSNNNLLVVNADAYIENKARTNLTLMFDYNKPQFSINGKLTRFNLPDLNPLLQSYTPASVEKGIVDEITFSGNAYRTNASGTMRFLYHDLKVDLALAEQGKWMNSVLAFAANTYLDESNPGSADLPPRIVHFQVERDMNKGFVNILIKSVLNGLKETMIMSKENKKAYKKAKKEMKKERKAAKKKAKKEAKGKS